VSPIGVGRNLDLPRKRPCEQVTGSGTQFDVEITFEMTDKHRVHSIHLSDRKEVERSNLTKKERVLIAVHQIELDRGTPNTEAVATLTGLSKEQVGSAFQPLRDKGLLAKNGSEHSVTHPGREWLIDEWGNDLPALSKEE
jgi:hypothetical protein